MVLFSKCEYICLDVPQLTRALIKGVLAFLRDDGWEIPPDSPTTHIFGDEEIRYLPLVDGVLDFSHFMDDEMIIDLIKNALCCKIRKYYRVAQISAATHCKIVLVRDCSRQCNFRVIADKKRFAESSRADKEIIPYKSSINSCVEMFYDDGFGINIPSFMLLLHKAIESFTVDDICYLKNLSLHSIRINFKGVSSFSDDVEQDSFGVEADDIIYMMCRTLSPTVNNLHIFSNDGDFCQLLGMFTHVKLYSVKGIRILPRYSGSLVPILTALRGKGTGVNGVHAILTPVQYKRLMIDVRNGTLVTVDDIFKRLLTFTFLDQTKLWKHIEHNLNLVSFDRIDNYVLYQIYYYLMHVDGLIN